MLACSAISLFKGLFKQSDEAFQQALQSIMYSLQGVNSQMLKNNEINRKEDSYGLQSKL